MTATQASARDFEPLPTRRNMSWFHWPMSRLGVVLIGLLVGWQAFVRIHPFTIFPIVWVVLDLIWPRVASQEWGITVRIGQLRELLVKLRRGKIKASAHDADLDGEVIKDSRLLGVPSPREVAFDVVSKGGARLSMVTPLIRRGLSTRATVFIEAGVPQGVAALPEQMMGINNALTDALEAVHLAFGGLDLQVSLLYSKQPPDLTPHLGYLEERGRTYKEEGSAEHRLLIEKFASIQELNAIGAAQGALPRRIIALHGLVNASWKKFAPNSEMPAEVFLESNLIKVARILERRLRLMGIPDARTLDANETRVVLRNGLDPISAPLVYQALDDLRRAQSKLAAVTTQTKEADVQRLREAVSRAQRAVDKLRIIPEAWERSSSGYLRIGNTLTAVLIGSEFPPYAEVGAMAELQQHSWPSFDISMTWTLSSKRREKRSIDNEGGHEQVLHERRLQVGTQEDLVGDEALEEVSRHRRQLHRSKGPATRGVFLLALNHVDPAELREMVFTLVNGLKSQGIEMEVLTGTPRTAAARLKAYGMPQPRIL